MHYDGTVYSEYFIWPEIHLTSQGDVLQSAQSRQVVLWAVDLQIICLLDRYPSNYLVEGDHIIFGSFSKVPLAQDTAGNDQCLVPKHQKEYWTCWDNVLPNVLAQKI